LEWIELADPGTPELFPKINAVDYYTQVGTHVYDDKVGWFGKGDYLTYNYLNFGSKGTTRSVRIRYSNDSHTAGKIELRLGDSTGTVIGEFTPSRTGGWDRFTDVNIGIDDVEGIHDLTIVATDGIHGTMNLEWLELSSSFSFLIDSDYKVDDTNGKDVQCSYSLLLKAFTDQIYTRYSMNNDFSSAETAFFSYLGVTDHVAATEAAYKLCGLAHASLDEM
jgi:hypothetical protein